MSTTLIISVVAGSIISMIILITIAIAIMFRKEIRNIRAARKLKGQEFVCAQSGKCCGYTVTVGEFDKHQMREAGFDPNENVTTRFGISYLKRVKGFCTFMKTDECSGKKSCGIYKDRFYICRRFPYLTYGGIKAIDTRCPEVQRMLRATPKK